MPGKIKAAEGPEVRITAGVFEGKLARIKFQNEDGATLHLDGMIVNLPTDHFEITGSQ